MLNQSIIMGRLTKDPETRYIQNSDNSVTRFTVAVERDYKAAGEDKPKTDYISCIAWNKTGEFIGKYFKKGSMIAVIGSIETGSYTNKDGEKVYTTDIRVSKASFTGEKREATDKSQFLDVPDGYDDEMPFH